MESLRILAFSSWSKLILTSLRSGQVLPTRGQKMSKTWSRNHFCDLSSSGMAFQMMERTSPAVQKVWESWVVSRICLMTLNHWS